MVDERDRARARLGLPPLATTSAAAPVNVVDEQAKIQAMRTSAPAREASPASFRTFEETGKSLESSTPPVTTVTQNPPPPTWVKASTVNTANGPVDVDVNGVAADGSVPVAVVTDTKPTGIPAGFTAGPFPKELEQFFGSSEGVLGYRIETLTDRNGRTYNQLSVATGPGSSKTFGAGFIQGPDGKYTPFSPDGGSGSSTLTGGATLKTEAQLAAEARAAQDRAGRQSAYDLLYSEFERYGLQSLVEPLKGLIISGASPSEFTIKLRETDAYKKRFAANEVRIKNGLRALSESEYIRNEDLYQEVMRRRGLPPEYYAKGDLGVQKGFDALIAGDVSSTELEDRIVTAQDRVLNANPEIAATLKQFYPGISNGDILAYALDPANAINQIKRKITAAEIGAAAGTYRLGITAGRAEQLASTGITEATAQQGFKTISQIGPRAEVLAEFYNQDPYTQETAEREVFGLTGAREAEAQRKKLTELETRAFQGSAGAGAIARDRAGVL